MNIKRLFLAAFIMIAAFSYGQDGRQPNVITTAVPFVSINPDSRGGAMGDCGVASSADVYSMHYNPAKYVYLEDKLTFGIGYSPWLHNLVSDMGLFYLAGAGKINERSSVAGTLRYFSPGEIEFRDEHNNKIGDFSPNEWAIDATYSRLLGDYLAGPNHTLPTQGTAKFSSPLSVDDFVKKTQYTYFTSDALAAVAEDVAAFARMEGLTGHARSALIRTKQ